MIVDFVVDETSCEEDAITIFQKEKKEKILNGFEKIFTKKNRTEKQQKKSENN